MDKEQKLNFIKKLEDKANEFNIVPELSESILSFRPSPDAWTIREQIAHCLDVDIANFHRYRRGITDPGATVLPLNPKWAEKLNYQASDVNVCISLIKILRKFIADHLKTIIDENWDEYYYIFGNEKKEKINLNGTLQLYIDHIDFHKELIDRNIDIYKDTTK